MRTSNSARRAFLCVLSLMLTACEAPVDEPVCEPLECEDYAASCGVVDDGCGHLLSCGTCGDNELCSGGACLCTTPLVRNDAGICADPPTPPSCIAGEDVACACGGSLFGAQTCRADGSGFEACRCACDALTCADYDATCGIVDDGCGALLQCGLCGADEACVSGTCECAGPFVRADDGTCGPVAPGAVNECVLGLSDCDVNATCTDIADGFECACRSGYEGDGRQCTPGADAVADISAAPAVLFVETRNGLALFEVDGLGRVGWDIPVTTVAEVQGNRTIVHKLPAGPATFAQIRFRGLRGDAVDEALAIAELNNRVADGAIVGARLAVALPNGGVVSIRLEGGVGAVDVDSTGNDGPILLGFDLSPSRLTLEAFESVDPVSVTRSPGHRLEVPGFNFGQTSLAFDDVDGVPVSGPTRMRRLAPAKELISYALQVRAQAGTGLDPRAAGTAVVFSMITDGQSGLEIGRRNAFDAWPASVSIFEPATGNEAQGLQITWVYDLAEDG